MALSRPGLRRKANGTVGGSAADALCAGRPRGGAKVGSGTAGRLVRLARSEAAGFLAAGIGAVAKTSSRGGAFGDTRRVGGRTAGACRDGTAGCRAGRGRAATLGLPSG